MDNSLLFVLLYAVGALALVGIVGVIVSAVLRKHQMDRLDTTISDSTKKLDALTDALAHMVAEAEKRDARCVSIEDKLEEEKRLNALLEQKVYEQRVLIEAQKSLLEREGEFLNLMRGGMPMTWTVPTPQPKTEEPPKTEPEAKMEEAVEAVESIEDTETEEAVCVEETAEEEDLFADELDVVAPVEDVHDDSEDLLESDVVEIPELVEELPALSDKKKTDFSTFANLPIERKYLNLPAEHRAWFDELEFYASSIPGIHQFSNTAYEDFKIGRALIVRLTIKRGAVQCEFSLVHDAFRQEENGDTKAVTVIRVNNPDAFEKAKRSIDMAVASSEEERRQRKEQQKLQRKLARQAKKALEAGASGAEDDEE